MSLLIDAIVIDNFEGVIELPKLRAATFAPTRTAGVGVQLMPAVGPQFTITTRIYGAAATRRILKDGLDAKKGAVVTLIEDGLNYSITPYFLRFLVEDVRHVEAKVVARACGFTGSAFNFSPAVRLVTEWTMRAVPA